MIQPEFSLKGEITFDEVEKRLRSITLLNQPGIHPYEEAKISVERFSYDHVVPTSRYLLWRQISVQTAINACLAPYGFDQLEQEEGLIVDGGEKGRQGLIPPIVEQFDFPSSRHDYYRWKERLYATEMPYVLDGSHRVNRGRLEGRDSFLAIFVRGIRSDCPPYAFPNRWDEIKVLTELPIDRKTWKLYRGDPRKKEQYALYRDYSPINGSTPRADNK